MGVARKATRAVTRPVKRAVRRQARRQWRRACYVTGAAVLVGAGCQALPGGGGVALPSLPSLPTLPSLPSLPGDDPAPTPTVAPVELAALRIHDGPHPGPRYDRGEWPHWLDPDSNGCDARRDALIAAANPPAQVGPGCRITGGQWYSDFDGVTTTDPGTFDVDHVVPLAEAHRSGGWAWSTDRRAQYANDPAVLWAVSATSNRAKSDKDPADWRPPAQGVWCTYARRWVHVKVTYDLTAESRERDALGAMLDTCPKEHP